MLGPSGPRILGQVLGNVQDGTSSRLGRSRDLALVDPRQKQVLGNQGPPQVSSKEQLHQAGGLGVRASALCANQATACGGWRTAPSRSSTSPQGRRQQAPLPLVRCVGLAEVLGTQTS